MPWTDAELAEMAAADAEIEADEAGTYAFVSALAGMDADLDNAGTVIDPDIRRARDYQRRARDYQRRYREANKDEIKDYQRRYYEANKDEIRDRQRRYREANKDEIRDRQRRYYEANKDEIRDRQRRYYEANREAKKNAPTAATVETNQ